jgi:hypothetical protein
MYLRAENSKLPLLGIIAAADRPLIDPNFLIPVCGGLLTTSNDLDDSEIQHYHHRLFFKMNDIVGEG